ncbi:putative nicotinate phosphoribosyltransferase [Aeromonas phage P19]|uniref:Nicotinamide phosphoribosyltransferase n=1 Tax=Aeromonas phage vB_AdhaM_G2 TaxID=3238786 RepID=A0AB39TYU6_9CAUD|nr:putative nicotinate phosphoribosyltransferase [Aeromonas phage P19]
MKYPHMSVDFYKWGHIDQYINGTELVISNLTPRSDRLANTIHGNGKMVFFGLQYTLQYMVEQWDQNFFSKSKEKVVKRFSRRVKNSIGKDHGDSMIKAIGDLHDLGYLPIEVRAIEEGNWINMGIPAFVVSNTKKEFFWLVNYLETFLSAMVWPMSNSAMVSAQYRKTSNKWAPMTGADDFWTLIANHCFAARGHRGIEDATISGMGQLLFSAGTDTGWAIDYIEDYYGANSDEELIGCSVNAFEHATATQRIAYFRGLGFEHAERESLRRLFTETYPTGILSYVADSEDYYRLLSVDLLALKDEIEARQPDSNGLCKFVVRPDSSPKTPYEVIMGDPEAEDENERKGSLQILWDIFGGTVNEKGFRVLNPKVGIIYGEAIDGELQEKIYAGMAAAGWCVSNVLMGTGSWGFLKNASRDSFSIAIKGTHSIVDGIDISMQKNPKTALNSKKSARGRLRVEKVDGDYVLFENQTADEFNQGELKLAFRDGKIVNFQIWKDIQARALAGL